MRRLKLTIEYDGTGYAGWQRQKNAKTIQEEIESAINIRFCEKRRVVGSGRTDAGVHARGQVAHVDLLHKIPPLDFMRALNTTLPDDIAIRHIEVVSSGFHARHDALMRWYRYVIVNTPYPPAIDRGKMLWVPRKLDMRKIKTAAHSLEGEHDFTSFASQKSPLIRPIRTISHLAVRKKADIITIDVYSRAFLRQMVRIIVGTLIDIGTGKETLYSMGEIIKQKSRKGAGITTPPHGLYLMKIWYDMSLVRFDGRGV